MLAIRVNQYLIFLFLILNKLFIDKPKIFAQFPNVVFGFSKKVNNTIEDNFNLNMSLSIGDNEENVVANREKFFNSIGLTSKNVVIQKQTQSNTVNIIEKFEDNLEGDALITKTKNLGLAISTADCTNIYLYDPKENIIAAVHSGWMGTEKKILEKTLKILINQFNVSPKNIYAYFGPSICQLNYEVGSDFSSKFQKKHFIEKRDRLFLDLKEANKDMLTQIGVPLPQIEISKICSFENKNFHSYRRDKNKSGRALGIISLKG